MTIANAFKYLTLNAGAVSLLSFGGLAITNPASAAAISLGDLTTWATFGDVSNPSQTASMSSNALMDDDFGIGPDSDFNFSGIPAGAVGIPGGLEEFLGLPIGALDPDANNFVFASEGSAIEKTFTVQAGDKLVFDYQFLTNEPSRSTGPLPDYAFLSIDGLGNPGGNSGCVQVTGDVAVLCTLAGIGAASNPSSPYTNETGMQSFNFTFASGGTFTIGLGVVDVEDFDVSSALVVANPIPEPSTLLGTIIVCGFSLLSINRKRSGSRQRGQ